MRIATLAVRSGWALPGRLVAAASALALLSVVASAASVHAQPTYPIFPTDAGTFGDQLMFFYDTTTDHTTFMTVGNTNVTGIVIETVFYSSATLQRVAERVSVIPAGGAEVIDPTTVTGVPGTAGIALVTPIVSEITHTPTVPVRPLVGGFTIVNVPLGSGTGQNPFGRLALVAGGGVQPRAAAGATPDGIAVIYQNINPGQPAPSLTLPVYFNPTTLAPPEQDGNRVFLASFTDQYAAPVGPSAEARFNIVPINRSASATFFNGSTGTAILTTATPVSGVRFDTLQNLAGGATLDTAGRLELNVPAQTTGFDNFFGMASQSLGTFSVGQRLVPVDF